MKSNTDSDQVLICGGGMGLSVMVQLVSYGINLPNDFHSPC